MTAAFKTLNLDQTDLKWLSEKLGHFEEGSFSTETATFYASYLDHTFKAKRVGVNDESDGTLVVQIRVPA